jgi:hypothetical protein
MLHIEAFRLPFRRDWLVFDFAHLAFLATSDLEFLGIWDLDLGIWDFQCAAHL